MVGLFVLSDQELVAEAERLLGPLGEVDMIPNDLKIRERLHTVNRKLMPDLKVALIIYEGSTLSLFSICIVAGMQRYASHIKEEKNPVADGLLAALSTIYGRAKICHFHGVKLKE